MAEGEDPQVRFVQQQEKRVEVEAAFFAWLRTHGIFRYFHKRIRRELRYLQALIPLREKTQGVVYQYVEQLRGLAQEIGLRAGLDKEAVFFLTYEEFSVLP